jgi:serine/threonine protein kinase
MGDDHPFAICPECLFRTALRAHPGAMTARPQGAAQNKGRDFIVTSQLFTRRDFFQKYEILEKLAGGGQGDVWKVWDFELRRCAAMKRISEQTVAYQSAVYRFLAEAQIASQLEHPGILPIFDVGLDPDGRPYYTTQLLPGTTLEDAWRQIHERKASEWNVNRALELMLRICDVMSHAHSRGVIHRDLKPSNMLIGAFGDVRVIDWGSAHVLEAAKKNFEQPFVPLNWQTVETDRGRAMGAEPQSPLGTAQSGYPGTLLFVPPEILAGKLQELGPATDIYSLGMMLYHLLAGRPAYSKADGSLPEQAELRPLILQGPPEPVRSVNRRVSRDLAAICEKAMAHDINGRYLTMEELAEDIRATLEVRPVRARKPTVFLKFQKWSQRNIAYVLTGSAALIIISLALSVAHGFKSQRDFARQMTTVRNAELASRNGHWRDALKSWREAESAGYGDPVYLELQQAEAWTILSEPDKSSALLQKLSRRSDLGGQRGAILLRLGEHELFDRPTAVQGARHIHEALAAGLTTADQSFASGLLADSTPEALEHFRQALQFDPYHHGAHLHSLGLEFLLGRHEEIENHVHVFKILYPDDPTPVNIEAAELAMAGNEPGARALLKPVRSQVSSNAWSRLNLVLQTYAQMSKFYDLDRWLDVETNGDVRTNRGNSVFTLENVFSAGNLSPEFRLPQLPCLQKGVLEGADALSRLAMPFLSSPQNAANQIQSAWRHHPEALVPVMGGLLLEDRKPAGEPAPPWLLQLQAGLFQLGADSPSMMPGMRRLSRYLAARAYFELNETGQTDACRSNCLANARQAVGEIKSPAECEAYFEFAFKLGDIDLARDILDRWARWQPDAPALRRGRIEIEVASGACGSALRLVDRLLADFPRDAWALDQRRRIVEDIKKLTAATIDQGRPGQ